MRAWVCVQRSRMSRYCFGDDHLYDYSSTCLIVVPANYLLLSEHHTNVSMHTDVEDDNVVVVVVDDDDDDDRSNCILTVGLRLVES